MAVELNEEGVIPDSLRDCCRTAWQLHDRRGGEYSRGAMEEVLRDLLPDATPHEFDLIWSGIRLKHQYGATLADLELALLGEYMRDDH